jgi:endonuclease/exonuclease/phosphatase family metal-dependent hydrolase
MVARPPDDRPTEMPILRGMELKTLTWNIGGGKLLQDGADPLRMASYAEDGLDAIAGFLESEEPDVIALQETQQKEGYDQVALIAGSLGYEHYFHDSTSESHIDTDCRLGHCVISKYPISQHRFGLFENPNARVTWEDGSIAMSHDKGFSSCTVSVGDTQVEVTTLHLIPFRRFKIELESRTAQGILQDVAGKLVPARDKALIQGDFNIDRASVQPYLRQLFASAGLAEVAIDEPTTPAGRRYDHILYKGLALKSTRIVSGVRTDHYPVIATFEVR